MSVANGISKLLQVRIRPLLEMFVKLRLVAAIFDAKLDDFFCRLRICKVKCRSRIELDVLGWDPFAGREEVTMDIENLTFHDQNHSPKPSLQSHLDGESSRLRNAILTHISGRAKGASRSSLHQALGRPARRNSDIRRAIRVPPQTCFV